MPRCSDPHDIWSNITTFCSRANAGQCYPRLHFGILITEKLHQRFVCTSTSKVRAQAIYLDPNSADHQGPNKINRK